MEYQVLLSDLARKQLKSLDKETSKRVVDKLEILRRDPLGAIKRLVGIDFYSLRAGDYRILLSIDLRQQVITVQRIGHRSNVYDRI